MLAISRCPIGRAYQAVASNWFSRQWNRFGGLTLGAGALRLGLNMAGDTLPEEKNILWNKTVANAFALTTVGIAAFQGYRFSKTQTWAPEWIKSNSFAINFTPMSSVGLRFELNFTF